MAAADDFLTRFAPSAAAPLKPTARPPPADTFLDTYKFTEAAPKPPATPKPAAQPRPAAPKPPTYGEDVRRRVQEGFDQAGQGAQGGDDLLGAIAGPLNAVGGLFHAAAAPIIAALDPAGRALEKATANAPHGKNFDLRFPKEFLGDAAEQIGGFLGGGPKAEAPRAGPGPHYAAFKPTEAEAAASHAQPPHPIPEPVTALPKPPQAATRADRFLDRLAPSKGKADDFLAKFDRPKSIAAAEGKADREIVAPGHQGEGGPVVGNEPDAVERVDNALYRLGGHATADKLEAQQFLKQVPEALAKPAVQEELYHAIEAKIADPEARIPPHLEKAFNAFKPYYEEQTAIINRLRERGDPAVEPYLEDQGYVARRAQGHTPLFDAALDPSERPRDPILGNRGLAKTTSAQKQRTAGFMVTDADGQTHFTRKVEDTDIKDRPYASVRQATTGEIEANSDTRYHKNALVNTVDNVLRLRRVERNLDVLDEVTHNLKDEGKAFQQEWHYKNEQGQWVRAQANGKAPDGFVELPHVPQLKGWKFDPQVAEALRDYYPAPDEPLDGILAKVNRGLMASLFITPIPHAANVGAHWASGRGWDWISPKGYRNLMQTGAKATMEVLTLGPEYKRLMREGSGLLYGDTNTRDFYKAMLEKAGHEVADDPKATSIFAKAAGVPVEWVKAAYSASNKALWAANDIFMLQRQLELEAKGMSPRKAIKEAERDIPNYRVPPQVLKSRAFSQFIKSPNYILFGRYKYGQMKAWGEMFKDLAGKGEPGAQKEALGKFLAAATISMGVYPMMDVALKQATGNQDARVKRAGPFSLTDAAYQWSTGQKETATALSSFFSPSPMMTQLIETSTNRDHFGRPIRTEGAPAPYQAAELAKHAVGSAVYPVQLGLDALKPDGGPGALGKLAGLELPTPKQTGAKKKYAAQRKKTGAKKTGRFMNELGQGDIGRALTDLGRN